MTQACVNALPRDCCASIQYCRFYTESFRFISQYYMWLSLLSTKTSSFNLFFQFQKMLRLYTANRRLMFKLTNVHRESKQRQTTAWMIVTIPPSWWWILVLRTQNFENCIMCRGSVDLLKGHCTNTPTISAYTI